MMIGIEDYDTCELGHVKQKSRDHKALSANKCTQIGISRSYAEGPRSDWVTKSENNRGKGLKQKRQGASRQSAIFKVATALCK